MEALSTDSTNTGSHFFPNGMTAINKSKGLEKSSKSADSAKSIRAFRAPVLKIKDDEIWFWGLQNHTEDLKAQIILAAQHNSNVLIVGETGTGKEWVAHKLYALRKRRLGLTETEGPYVSVNSGAIPEPLIESILFGHERGAFTSARERQLGKFELARKGCLFLDEIQTLPLLSQIKLLRVLQNKTVERLGGKEAVKISCQILAATNVPLEILVEQGKFRKDLYYRLNIFPIYIPALRHRMSDLPAIAESMLKKIQREMSLESRVLSDEALEIICSYDWPGNIRELEHALFYATVRSQDKIQKQHLPWTLNGNLADYLKLGDWKI